MDGSAIDSILPVFSVLVTAFWTIVQCGELQTFIPAMPEESTSPMRALLFSHIFFSFFPVLFFFISSFLLLVLLFLVALFFLLTVPFVEENTRSHPGFRGFPHFNLTFQDARLTLMDLFNCYLSSRVN
jgi:hypothetical protein